jgi:hypothetical protein
VDFAPPLNASEGLACIGEGCFKPKPTPDNPNPAGPMDVPADLCAQHANACFPACSADGDIDDCPQKGVLFPYIVPRDNAEQYQALDDPKGPFLYERLWVNYHADRGNTRSDIRLLRDGNADWNGDYATNYYAPKAPGPVHVWAVVRDNRGGEDWVHVPLQIVQ